MASPTTKRRLVTGLALLAVSAASAVFTPAEAEGSTAAVPTAEQVEAARLKSEKNPADARLRYDYAEMLRKSGRIHEACRQYFKVTDIDASYFVAYHQLSQYCKDEKLLSDATERLEYLKEEKPHELMLRVALSELLEEQGKYFLASKTLIDLVYSNAVPPKYIKKVNARIRFLQAKAREAHTVRQATQVSNQMETAPLPLPEENLKRGLAASRLTSPPPSKGYGHARLQH